MMIAPISNSKNIKIPLVQSRISAGFPSPADDYLDPAIDLNEHLITNPAATFLVRVKGTSMMEAGIYEGDVLVVDRSISASDNHVIIAMLDGEFMVKRLRQSAGKTFLEAANKIYAPIELKGEQELVVWGVVTYVIHRMG